MALSKNLWTNLKVRMAKRERSSKRERESERERGREREREGVYVK